MLKTWIKSPAEQKTENPDPFAFFSSGILGPEAGDNAKNLQYLELYTIIGQSRKLVEQLLAQGEEGSEILSELYSEEVSQNTKQAQQAVPVPECLAKAFMIPRGEI